MPRKQREERTFACSYANCAVEKPTAGRIRQHEYMTHERNKIQHKFAFRFSNIEVRSRHGTWIPINNSEFSSLRKTLETLGYELELNMGE